MMYNNDNTEVYDGYFKKLQQIISSYGLAEKALFLKNTHNDEWIHDT
jgi:hypothetical protein